jgi:acetyltransferase-like isoleucine patch superfamily enzyme
MRPRTALKRLAQGIALILVFPYALASVFGRVQPIYEFFAHALAAAPGIPGNFLRAAYYRLTLAECSIDTNLWYGTIVVNPGTKIGAGVSAGCYCVIGKASIGRGTQIASHVSIPGGRKHHVRDAEGRLGGTTPGNTVIGEYCWIGEAAIVMGNVGAGTTIGAGAVVVKDIPAEVVAVGNPARVIRGGEA